MDLRGTNIRDTYGNVVTIGEVAGKPTAGFLANGDGERLTDVSVAGTVTSDALNVGADTSISDANGVQAQSVDATNYTGALVDVSTTKASNFYTKGGGRYRGAGTGLENTPNNFIKFHWVNDGATPYFNIPNNQDFVFPYRTDIQLGTTYDGRTETNGTDFWNVINQNNSGSVDNPVFRFRGAREGYYEWTAGVRLYDLFNNVDVVVKVFRGATAFGSLNELVGILADTKFAEATSDHLITGSNIFYHDDTSEYYTLAVNVSGNTPYPSDFFNTPPFFTVKYLGFVN